MVPWVHPNSQPKWHLDRRFSRFYTAHGRASLYFTMDPLFPWIFIASSHEGSWPHLIHDFLGHLSPQPKRHLDWFSCFAQLTCECHYVHNGTSLSPSKLPIPMGDLGPSLTWFLGPTRVLNPNCFSIGSAVFAGLTTVTDRQTDRPRYSVCNNRPHLHTQYCDAAQ